MSHQPSWFQGGFAVKARLGSPAPLQTQAFLTSRRALFSAETSFPPPVVPPRPRTSRLLARVWKQRVVCLRHLTVWFSTGNGFFLCEGPLRKRCALGDTHWPSDGLLRDPLGQPVLELPGGGVGERKERSVCLSLRWRLSFQNDSSRLCPAWTGRGADTCREHLARWGGGVGETTTESLCRRDVAPAPILKKSPPACCSSNLTKGGK